jgi:hypothetical protein
MTRDAIDRRSGGRQRSLRAAAFLLLFFIGEPIFLPLGGEQADVSGFRSLVRELLCL